jgi:hypothetical protein
MRIAHITDLHLRHHLPGSSALPRRLSRAVPDLLEEAVLGLRADAPDLLAVTGDLLDYPVGTSDGDLEARAERDLELVREILAPLGCPMALLYGNHDPPVAFRKILGLPPPEFDVCGCRVLSFLDEELQDHFPERMGSERRRLLDVLADRDPRPQIHLQHYLVAPERNAGYPHTYREAGRLKASLLDDPRVLLVLSGHYHPGEPLFAEGHVHFAVAPAFCELPHAYRIYHVAGRTVRHEERSLREADAAGAPGPAQSLQSDRDFRGSR